MIIKVYRGETDVSYEYREDEGIDPHEPVNEGATVKHKTDKCLFEHLYECDEVKVFKAKNFVRLIMFKNEKFVANIEFRDECNIYMMENGKTIDSVVMKKSDK